MYKMIVFFPLQAHFIQCADCLPFNIILLGIIPCVSLTYMVLLRHVLLFSILLFSVFPVHSMEFLLLFFFKILCEASLGILILSLTPLLTVTPYPFSSHTLNLTPTQLRTYHPELGMPFSNLAFLAPV
jgi:hypothetical protein